MFARIPGLQIRTFKHNYRDSVVHMSSTYSTAVTHERDLTPTTVQCECVCVRLCCNNQLISPSLALSCFLKNCNFIHISNWQLRKYSQPIRRLAAPVWLCSARRPEETF